MTRALVQISLMLALVVAFACKSRGSPLKDEPSGQLSNSQDEEQDRSEAPPSAKRRIGDIIKIFANFDLESSLDNENPALRSFRISAFEQAISVWNMELSRRTRGKIHLQSIIELPETRRTSGIQTDAGCLDSRNGLPIFNVEKVGDGDSSISAGGDSITGEQGWTIAAYEGIGSQQIPFEALADTALEANGEVIESGKIVYYTHYREAAGCMPIPWYFEPPAINFALRKGSTPVAVPIAKFDFYSVMLHEIGHLIGLEHCVNFDSKDPSKVPVMSSTINMGSRAELTSCEFDQLNARYGMQRDVQE